MEYTLCTYRIAEDIRPFVEVSKVDFPNKLWQNVSSNFMHQVLRIENMAPQVVVYIFLAFHDVIGRTCLKR